jgi:hypothetical protein
VVTSLRVSVYGNPRIGPAAVVNHTGRSSIIQSWFELQAVLAHDPQRSSSGSCPAQPAARPTVTAEPLSDT